MTETSDGATVGMDTDIDGSIMGGVLHQLVTGIEAILHQAEQTITDLGGVDFESSKIGMLWSAMSLYADTFKRFGCSARSDMDEEIKSKYRYPEVRDNYEHLLEVENEWDSMLVQLDDSLRTAGEEDQLVVGAAGPKATLVDAVSGKEQTLSDYLDGGAIMLVLLRHFA